ncbi:MAG: type IX secretion system membrane protein PorP/SprF [Aureispira sp.]|nr:type IX secretion system membrane protein PorP/SprF [Aureispira sp.]
MMRYSLLLVVFLGTSMGLKAQQDAQYTQFMFNKLYFNPAYAGSKEALNVSAIYRKQWLGIKGSPQTATLNLHAPVFKNRIGLGLSVTNDQLGFSNSWNIETSYSYRIKFKNKHTLSMGLRGSASFYQVRWDKADPTQLMDGTIPGALATKILPNFGAGVYYDAPRFYVGFSIPHIFENRIDFTDNKNSSIEPRLGRHYFLMGGAIFDIARNVKLKPAAMLKFTPNSPFDMDINISFLFWERFWAGVTYRLGDSIDLILQYQFNSQFKLGIAYDFTLTKLQQYNAGSFEVMLEVNFVKNKNMHLRNPRYF